MGEKQLIIYRMMYEYFCLNEINRMMYEYFCLNGFLHCTTYECCLDILIIISDKNIHTSLYEHY